MSAPSFTVPAGFLPLLENSSSRTLYAVEVARQSKSGTGRFRYYLDTSDVTFLVLGLLGVEPEWDNRFGHAVSAPRGEGHAARLQQALGPLGLEKVVVGSLAPLPQGVILEGLLLKSKQFVDKHGVAMHQLTVLGDVGNAYTIEFSTYATLTEGSIGNDVPEDRADRAVAARVVAMLDRERELLQRENRCVRVRVGWIYVGQHQLVLRFGSTLPAAVPANPEPARKTSGRGGAGRGQGRKPLKPATVSVATTIRMTPEQREKFARLGGADWFRQCVDDAPEPPDGARGPGATKESGK